jgi:hypothetical protein
MQARALTADSFTFVVRTADNDMGGCRGGDEGVGTGSLTGCRGGTKGSNVAMTLRSSPIATGDGVVLIFRSARGQAAERSLRRCRTQGRRSAGRAQPVLDCGREAAAFSRAQLPVANARWRYPSKLESGARPRRRQTPRFPAPGAHACKRSVPRRFHQRQSIPTHPGFPGMLCHSAVISLDDPSHQAYEVQCLCCGLRSARAGSGKPGDAASPRPPGEMGVESGRAIRTGNHDADPGPH